MAELRKRETQRETHRTVVLLGNVLICGSITTPELNLDKKVSNAPKE